MDTRTHRRRDEGKADDGAAGRFGSDPHEIAPKIYRRAVRAVRESAGCLVWIPPDAA